MHRKDDQEFQMRKKFIDKKTIQYFLLLFVLKMCISKLILFEMSALLTISTFP